MFDAHKMAQGGVRPEDALRCDTLACLAQVHGDRRAEEVLDLLAVCVRSEPAWATYVDAAHHKRGEMEERHAVKMGRKQTGHILLKADE